MKPIQLSLLAISSFFIVLVIIGFNSINIVQAEEHSTTHNNDENEMSAESLTSDIGKEEVHNLEGDSLPFFNNDPSSAAYDDEDEYEDGEEEEEKDSNFYEPHTRTGKQLLYRRHRKQQFACHDDSAPKIGDVLTIHIPSREHLVPRFHGLRVFTANQEGIHEKKTSKEVFDHHHSSKVLYCFDEHVIQGVWPHHALDGIHHGGRTMNIKVMDLFVRKERLSETSQKEEEVCFFKVNVVGK